MDGIRVIGAAPRIAFEIEAWPLLQRLNIVDFNDQKPNENKCIKMGEIEEWNQHQKECGCKSRIGVVKKKSHEIVMELFFLEAKAKARDSTPIRPVGCLTSTV